MKVKLFNWLWLWDIIQVIFKISSHGYKDAAIIITAILTKTEHPFADLLRNDWQSLRQRWGQNKNKFCFHFNKEWGFFSIKWLGYVTYNVNLHYSSNTENISLQFSFIKTRSSMVLVLITVLFFLYTLLVVLPL